MEMMTIEEFRNLKDAVDEAKNDDTPYLGVVDDEIHVVGNPNKTQLVPHNYNIKFAFPKTNEWREALKADKGFKIEKETENYIFAYREYKNVWVTPRRVGDCVEAFTRIISFMRTANEKGDIEDVSESDMLSVMTHLNKEVEDSVYDALAAVVGIPKEIADYMVIDSVFFNVVKIIHDTPDIINSADLFFEPSQENA